MCALYVELCVCICHLSAPHILLTLTNHHSDTVAQYHAMRCQAALFRLCVVVEWVVCVCFLKKNKRDWGKGDFIATLSLCSLLPDTSNVRTDHLSTSNPPPTVTSAQFPSAAEGQSNN